MLGLLKVLQHSKYSVQAWPHILRAGPTSSCSVDLVCTRHIATSAKAFAVGDSTRSGSLELFDRQACQQLGSYLAPTAVTTCLVTYKSLVS